LLSAEYFPPVRKGSLNEITPGRVVAIIDGEIPPDAFLPESEVRAALDRGVVLFGAASVGAFHASNFATHGMHGVGWVYDQYRAGALPSFDEIALMYDPVSLRALSVPLVNVRFWLEGLIALSRLRPEDVTVILNELRRLPIPDRDAVGIRRCIAGLFGRSALKNFDVPSDAFPDVKANDAKMLLQLLARRSENGR
jgi:ribosomal protein S12 methylthiotransferase accessory factor